MFGVCVCVFCSSIYFGVDKQLSATRDGSANQPCGSFVERMKKEMFCSFDLSSVLLNATNDLEHVDDLLWHSSRRPRKDQRSFDERKQTCSLICLLLSRRERAKMIAMTSSIRWSNVPCLAKGSLVGICCAKDENVTSSAVSFASTSDDADLH